MTLNRGGWSREVTGRELPIATTLAGVNMSLTAGGVRELHWHQQVEWAYMILGRARITSIDDGTFSDFNTLSISDWFAHTPKDVLSANFGVPVNAFNHIPSEQVYIYQDKVPGPLESEKVQSPYGTYPSKLQASAGDVGYVPFATGHYIQNTGNETLWFLEMFKSDWFVDVSLNQWMAITPSDLVNDNLHVGPELLHALRKVKWPVVKYPGFSYYPK